MTLAAEIESVLACDISAREKIEALERIAFKHIARERIQRRARFGFSRRQREVAGLLCQGKSRKEIADALGINLETVRDHVRVVLDKTKAQSALQLVSILLE